MYILMCLWLCDWKEITVLVNKTLHCLLLQLNLLGSCHTVKCRFIFGISYETKVLGFFSLGYCEKLEEEASYGPHFDNLKKCFHDNIKKRGKGRQSIGETTSLKAETRKLVRFINSKTKGWNGILFVSSFARSFFILHLLYIQRYHRLQHCY